MGQKELLLAIAILALPGLVMANTEIHVAKSGNDSNSGGSSDPYLTINKAASVAQPGDTVIVHAGTYRESVKPQRGGTGEDARIKHIVPRKARKSSSRVRRSSRAGSGSNKAVKTSAPGAPVIMQIFEVVGFEKPIRDCSIALANVNPIKDQCDNGDNIYLYTDPAGKKWWGVRREGNSTYPPRRAPGNAPFPEPGEPLRSQLKTESMFENDRLTNPDDDPTSDGFPSIDTYRTLQFYIETTDGGTPPSVLNVSTSTSAPTN